jgi:uncharacterized membrane protein
MSNSPPNTSPAPSDTEITPNPKLLAQLRSIQRLAIGSLIGLIILSLVWELWLAPLRPGGSWLALKALPLCIPLAGFLKHRMYTYRWVSLMVWLYFAEGVTRATSDRAPSSYLAMIEVVLCLMLFAACAMHVRLRVGKKARQA